MTEIEAVTGRGVGFSAAMDPSNLPTAYALYDVRQGGIVPRSLSGVLRDRYVMICQGVDWNAREAYDRAESLFVMLSNLEPLHPVGPLMHAATLNVAMVDRESYDRVEEFECLLDTAEARAQAWLADRPQDAWGYCMLGHIYGYRAVYQAKFGSWFAALKLGLKARGAYHDALDLDSTCWDAYIGLGSYHYWKSARTEFINWLPLFVNDDKDKGQREMHLALEHSYFTRSAAAAGLVAIYLHREEYDSALTLARDWGARFPEGKAFFWGQAYALYELEWNDSALAMFDTLKARVRSDTGQSYYNYIEIDLRRGELLDRLGQQDRACALMDSVLAYPAAAPVRERAKNQLETARKFVKSSCARSGGD